MAQGSEAVVRNLAVLGTAAVIAGAGIGFVGGAFRWVLHEFDLLRGGLADWASGVPGGVLAVMAVTAAAAALAVALVRLSPRSAGSGIGQVEAIYHQQIVPPPYSVMQPSPVIWYDQSKVEKG